MITVLSSLSLSSRFIYIVSIQYPLTLLWRFVVLPHFLFHLVWACHRLHVVSSPRLLWMSFGVGMLFSFCCCFLFFLFLLMSVFYSTFYSISFLFIPFLFRLTILSIVISLKHSNLSLLMLTWLVCYICNICYTFYLLFFNDLFWSLSSSSSYVVFMSLKIISWNVRGLNSPIKCQLVLSHLSKLGADIVLLQESHLSAKESLKLTRGWIGEVFLSPGDGKRTGVITLCHKSIDAKFAFSTFWWGGQMVIYQITNWWCSDLFI